MEEVPPMEETPPVEEAPPPVELPPVADTSPSASGIPSVGDTVGETIRSEQEVAAQTDASILEAVINSNLNLVDGVTDPLASVDSGIEYSGSVDNGTVNGEEVPVTTSDLVTTPANSVATYAVHNVWENQREEDSKGVGSPASRAIAFMQAGAVVKHQLTADKRSALSFTAQLQKDAGRLPVTAPERISG
jgi:hypothetical protein